MVDWLVLAWKRSRVGIPPASRQGHIGRCESSDARLAVPVPGLPQCERCTSITKQNTVFCSSTCRVACIASNAMPIYMDNLTFLCFADK